jgi:selenocysteine lyase/cysteine desulfurase
VGAGFLHVRRARIEKLWPLFPAPAAKATDIRKLEAIGTHPLAVLLATGDALAFHESLGAERKAARLRYLRERWTERLARLQGARMLTSSDPAQSCAIGYVSFAGVDHDALARRLLEKHRIYVAPFWHEESPGIRVSPGIYTTAKEIDAFASAVEDELRG